MKIHNEKIWALFFAVAACSWMPHWTCHYYRLETGSSFVAGSWDFSRADSVGIMLAYTALIVLNLVSVADARFRFASALVSGVSHMTFGVLHLYRLIQPFRFEVFGYEWSMGASLRETFIELFAGAVCLWVAMALRRERR